MDLNHNKNLKRTPTSPFVTPPSSPGKICRSSFYIIPFLQSRKMKHIFGIKQIQSLFINFLSLFSSIEECLKRWRIDFVKHTSAEQGLTLNWDIFSVSDQKYQEKKKRSRQLDESFWYNSSRHFSSNAFNAMQWSLMYSSRFLSSPVCELCHIVVHLMNYIVLGLIMLQLFMDTHQDRLNWKGFTWKGSIILMNGHVLIWHVDSKHWMSLDLSAHSCLCLIQKGFVDISFDLISSRK